jgi:murein L,D-transpeptidase YcbB/YkuD
MNHPYREHFARWLRQHCIWLLLLGALGLSAVSRADPVPAVVPVGVWVENNRANALAQEAIDILAAAQAEGLNPSDYDVTALHQQQRALGDWLGADSASALSFDATLSNAVLRYLNDLALGRVKAKDVHQDYDTSSHRDFDAVDHLNAAITASRRGSTFAAVMAQAAPNFPLYAALKRSLADYRHLSADPAWFEPLAKPTGNKLELGDDYSDLVRLQARLVLLGDMPERLPAKTYDLQMVQAVESFQSRHGLLVDGVIGPQTLEALNVTPLQRVAQIALSMERLRWTPLQQGDRLIVVNIPGFTLYAYEVDAQGKLNIQVEMRVVIGRSLNHRTPIFDEDMQFIEFSPYWNVPISIARSETIPAIERNANYLASQGMEFVDRQGNVSFEVSAEKLQAVRNGQLRIRQRPGPKNALGDIKFIFPNNQNIFLHHTPATQLFSLSRRDFSHGCIRVEDPVALAQFVLQDEPQWTVDRIREAMTAGTSRTIKLRNPLPVLIGYSTVIARDSKVYFYPDIYGHDRSLDQALRAARQLN